MERRAMRARVKLFELQLDLGRASQFDELEKPQRGPGCEDPKGSRVLERNQCSNA